LQKELCLEALRLGLMLTEYVRTNLPKTNALLALMCFHTSRFDARLSNQDALVLYEHQDHACWDMDLINQGWHYLSLSTQGEELSPYHIEAKIASWHSVKEDTPEKWKDILNLYDQLLLMQYSQTVALNRAFAVYKLKGREAALAEAEKLKLENNHFYFVLLGELFRNLDNSRAELYLKKAYALARTKPEKQLIRTKMEGLS
jgi:predicted RNA polymerase sigma factor